MVLRTPPLSSLKKGLLPQIHQPLPLNRRQSQHLLESITSSFRKNLDQEHPWGPDETPTNTPPNSEQSSAEPLPTTDHRPTDRHLRAILSNPLFSHPRNVDVDTSTHISTTKPFVIFDSAVSKGLMTPRRATGFLATIVSQLKAESHDNVRQRMGVSGGGLRVLRWLRASGLENNLNFLSYGALVRLLVSFLYAEGLEDVVWTWLARLATRIVELELEKTPGKANAESLCTLISAIIDTSHESGSPSPVSLDGCFAALAKVNGMLPDENPATAAAIRKGWIKLSWAATVNALQRPKPSVTLFENFVEIGRPLHLPLELAHLDLHHPTNPTSSAAIEYLRARHEIADDVSNMLPASQQRVLYLVLDAAQRLRRTGQVADALWVERIRSVICERLNLAVLNTQMGDSLNSNIPIHRGL
ncbi:hypothetical protein GGS24DRAFT_143168 [Hypoxylon argillaceum]|nr:hypothetical protein GGS24DRAFT_143168 [Hypoxylon argillaceum]KAI1155211.1 hypothetical protein F4825DRAFT_83928 [Nemania diffusa]